jgi:hypothetical protein
VTALLVERKVCFEEPGSCQHWVPKCTLLVQSAPCIVVHSYVACISC